MELNRDKIIKALECCIHSDSEENYCINCPYYAEKYCAAKISTDALALIKELTEEKYDIECSYNALRRDNERLHATCTELERNLHTVQADTVKRMQEWLKFKFGTYVLGYKIPLAEALEFVNQIAKAMLKEDNSDV